MNRLLLAAFSVLGMVLAATLHASPVSSVCTHCVNGICQDTAPAADNNTVIVRKPVTMWVASGNSVALTNVSQVQRKVVLKTCTGLKFEAFQLVGLISVPVRSPVTHQPIILPLNAPEVAQHPAVNGPSTGNPWPPPFPYNNLGTNCHAETLGIGQGQPSGGGATTMPPATPPPPPLPPTNPPAVPTTGAGFWLNDPAAAFKDPCWHRCTNCGAPPPNHPAGRVVIWYSAPEGAQTDHGHGTALHSATSNGNGTYSSKNGASANSSSKTEAELDGQYGAEGTVKDGRKIHKVVMIKDC